MIITFTSCKAKETEPFAIIKAQDFHQSAGYLEFISGAETSAEYTFTAENSETINWQGSSSSKGYYISNGAVQRIRWSQSGESSYLKFYDENGKELEINRGKSYIAYTSSGKTTVE